MTSVHLAISIFEFIEFIDFDFDFDMRYLDISSVTVTVTVTVTQNTLRTLEGKQGFLLKYIWYKQMFSKVQITDVIPHVRTYIWVTN